MEDGKPRRVNGAHIKLFRYDEDYDDEDYDDEDDDDDDNDEDDDAMVSFLSCLLHCKGRVTLCRGKLTAKVQLKMAA